MKMFRDMTKKEKMELYEAYVDGKKLQLWSSISDKWILTSRAPNQLQPDSCWRIAPPKPKELWVNEYASYYRGHCSKEEAISWANKRAKRVAVHYVEKIEGEEG